VTVHGRTHPFEQAVEKIETSVSTELVTALLPAWRLRRARFSVYMDMFHTRDVMRAAILMKKASRPVAPGGGFAQAAVLLALPSTKVSRSSKE